MVVVLPEGMSLEDAVATVEATSRRGAPPSHAVLCATTGLIRRLDTEDLEGVLSHIAHRDVAVITVASFLGVLAGLLTRFGLYAGLGGGFGGGRRRNNQNNNTALVVLAVVAVSAVVYALAFLLTRALSRYRELSADRSGALLTGHPPALASALTKISSDMARIPARDLRHVEPYNAFFFAPPTPTAPACPRFSTHPPLQRRLDQLAGLARDYGREG